MKQLLQAGEAAADVDKFLRDEVVAWMSTLEAVGSSLPEALDAALAAFGETPEGLVQAFKPLAVIASRLRQ